MINLRIAVLGDQSATYIYMPMATDLRFSCHHDTLTRSRD